MKPIQLREAKAVKSRYRVIAHSSGSFFVRDTKTGQVVGRAPTREGANRIRRDKEKLDP